MEVDHIKFINNTGMQNMQTWNQSYSKTERGARYICCKTENLTFKILMVTNVYQTPKKGHGIVQQINTNGSSCCFDSVLERCYHSIQCVCGFACNLAVHTH